MFQTLTNVALRFMGRIPLIRELVPEKYKNNSTNSKHSREELETLHKYPQKDSFQVDTENAGFGAAVISNQQEQTSGKTALLTTLKTSNEEILDKLPDLKEAISNHIEKSEHGIRSRINFREEVITNKALATLNALITNYQKKFPLIQHTNAGTVNPEEYVELIQEYILKSIKFILEINNHILHRTATLDPYVNDQHIAEAFAKTKGISKKIAERAFGALYESFQQLPQISFESNQGTVHITPYISSRLREGIKTLYLASKFGVQSSEPFQKFKDAVQMSMPSNSTTIDNSLHNTLTLIKAFQQATHGSIILNPQGIDSGNIGIANLDKQTKEQIISSLIHFIIQEYTIRHDDTDNRTQLKLINFIQNTKKDLAYCLKKIDDCETTTSKMAAEIANEDILKNLGLEDELANIKTLYSLESSTRSLLGYSNDEVIMGQTHRGKPIINHLDVTPNNPKIELERIIHEISLLAVMNALSNFRGRKGQNPILESSNNFQTIPWLKSLYQERYKEYQSWIESEQETKLPTRALAKELARLGSELHDSSSQSNPMFSFLDFCERYKIKDIGEAMLTRVSNLTDTGTVALQLELFSKLFSYLRRGEQEGLSDEEVKKIQDLTDFLLEQSILRDKDGKQIIAPKNDELYQPKYEYMKALIGNRGTLILNTPIIIKFLLNSLGIEKNHTKVLKENSVEKKNAILASLLFYILLKHLPEQSNDIDSLLKRQEIFTTLIDNFKSFTEQLPVLKNKVLRQSLGLNETYDGADPSKTGIIQAMCQDMERQLSEYPKRAKLFQELEQKRKILEEEYLHTHDSHIAKEINNIRNQERIVRPITLQNLLAVYDQLSECINRNPNNVQEIQKLLKNFKHTDGPLLKDLRNYIGELIEVEPLTLMKFIKTSANQDLQIYTKKFLLNQASKLTQELISTNSNKVNGTIQILDNDESAIRKYSKILNSVKYIAFLVNHYGANQVSINSAGIDETSPSTRPEIINHINIISNLIRRNILLLVDDHRTNEEVFPGQLEAKRTLLDLLEEFGIKSDLNHKIEWTSLKRAQRIIEESRDLAV